MDKPVHAFVLPVEDEFVTLKLHFQHKMHDGAIFAMRSEGVYQAVQGCWGAKLEQMGDLEARLAHYTPAERNRKRADHASASVFAVPRKWWVVSGCPLLDPSFDTVDWDIRAVRHERRERGFTMGLHMSQLGGADERRHVSIMLDFELLIALPSLE